MRGGAQKDAMPNEGRGSEGSEGEGGEGRGRWGNPPGALELEGAKGGKRAQGLEVKSGDGAGLASIVNGKCGNVANGEYVNNLIKITVLIANNLRRLQAQFLMCGAANKIAHKCRKALPFEGLHHQIPIDA